MPTVADGTGLTPEQLVRNALHGRAIEAVIWGMPAVNTDLMFQALAREVKSGWNQIVYGSRLLDWKNQSLRTGCRRVLRASSKCSSVLTVPRSPVREEDVAVARYRESVRLL